MPHSRSTFACCLLALIAGSLFSSNAKAIVVLWDYGLYEYEIGTDSPCGGGVTEPRMNGYAAQSWLPPGNTPAVGEIFYAKLVLGHPGNPCVISAVDIQLLLPAGVTTAISAANPVFCFARLPPNIQHNYYLLDNLADDPDYGCPQSFSQGIYGQRILAPNGGVGAGLWGMAAGFALEFLVPLTASVPQNGANFIGFRVQPDLSEFGTPRVPANVNSDVLFRTSFEDQGLTLDICTFSPIAQGC
jgi:hypothetical protein